MTDREMALLVVSSVGYRAFTGPLDREKVEDELRGVRRRPVSGSLARVVVELARRASTPVVEPPPEGWDPLAFWRSRGLWFAWGIENGSISPAQACARAKAIGAGWIGVQDSPQARRLADELRAACTRAGLRLVSWRGNQAEKTLRAALDCVRAFRPDAHAENVEHLDWDPRIPAGVRAAFPRLALGVFTNLWGAGAVPTSTSPTGYSREAARPWVDNGWAYLTEAYMVNEQGPQPTLSPAHLDWTARTHLGVPETFPVVGIYRVPLSYYAEPLAAFPHWSVYLAEYLP